MLKPKYSGCEFKYFGVKERTLSMQEGRPEGFTNFQNGPVFLSQNIFWPLPWFPI